MMFCSLQRDASLRGLLLSGVLLAASSALSPLAAQQDWTASIETPAERAYRAVEERSRAMPKRGGKSANAKPKGVTKKPPVAAAAVIPDLPERPDLPDRKFITPQAVAQKPVDDAFVTEPPNAQPQREPQALAEPLIAPKGLGDVLTTQVLSEEPEPSVAPEPKPTPAVLPQSTGDQYCKSINNAAADARFAWQKKTLAETEKQVEKRVEELNAKIAEYQTWMARRDDFSRKAQSAITDIYAKMKPDAAALQLTALDEETAAAVLTKLSPKISSAVMAEMDAKKAARLTTIISGSAKGPKGKPPAPPAAPPTSGGT